MSEPSAPLRNYRFIFLAAAVVAGACGVGWAVGRFRPNPEPVVRSPETTAADGRRGEVLFQVHCASCHGPDGQGDGPSAAALKPPPRDFAARPWRFPVTPESIRRVTTDGIPGTAMAAFGAALSPADLDTLTMHVHRLATNQPTRTNQPTVEETLLHEAGFVDLRGTTPPPLIVSDAAGKMVRLSDFQGRVALVHIWGISCTHCLKAMPRLIDLESAFAGKGLVVLHVCADADDVKDAQALAEKTVPGVRVFADAAGVGLARFEVQTLPTVWLIGPDGQVIGRTTGAQDWAAQAVRKLIEHWLPNREAR
ncbi:c-type cytochrome [Fimbriiglobus ruber]|uniref:Thioredoxin family protein n=1 Tax=Fimbriiglobus ruber TaxID=1908690 RepID=A0A225DST0_9BACT|nr:c-type cytochrome [Fimbriiglobus ruber]OWK44371.1 thioredoxin family protein [Fimbriiglobus ruber]